MNEDILISVLPYLSVIHHIDGRIRLRINSKIKQEFQDLNTQDLQNYINKIPGITALKFNPINGSLTINYDNKIIKEDFVNSIFSGKIDNKIREFLNKIEA